MQAYNNIHLIGTSHISPESIQEVTDYIHKNQPGIIAIELDKSRLKALFSRQKPSLSDIRRLGAKGFLFSIIGHYIEKKLGKLVGTSPGDEMKTAISLAKQYKLKLALIDQPIDITLKRLSSQLTWKEKFRFLLDIITSPLRKPPIEPFDLKKVPSEATIKKIILYIEARYPTIHKVLLQERNEVMAKNLYTLMHKHPNTKILAIVGAAHKNAILNAIRIQINRSNHSNINDSIRI